MQLDLSGKTIFVTGASAGLGAGIAGCPARDGVRLAINARRQDALRGLSEAYDAGCRIIL